MDEEIVELYNEFLKIKEMGWVKTKRNGSGGIGYTFESLLGKQEDNLPVPDFCNIEIKTMRKKSRHMLHLMTLTPDGDFLFPIKRILEDLGYPSKWNKEYKVLMVKLNALSYSRIGWDKKVKLKVNYKEQKIELDAINRNKIKIDIAISWSFEWLKQCVMNKLKYLAIIKADNEKIDEIEYFKYSEINFYKMKDFSVFLKLIERGIISITFCIDVFKSGCRIGQIYDHGTTFTINLWNINELYEEIK